MTFRQQAKHSLKAGDWFRAVAGGVLAVVVAACVVVPPVSVTGDAPALTAVQSNFALGVGQEQSLLPFIRIAGTGEVPFTPLKWEVSDPSLLSIDPATGRAKGLAAGTAVVKVTVQGRESGSAQLFVEVAGEGAAAVREIRVRPASHNLVVGEEVVLRAEVVLPDGQINGNVAWSSSDDTIAKVNPTTGAVSALKPGRVTIVAAYAAYPAFKNLAEIVVYATRAEVPSSPTPLPSAAPTSSTTSPIQAAVPPTAQPLSANPASTVKNSLESVTVTTLGDLNSEGGEQPFKFSGPKSVTVDTAGTVYVADLYARIWKITSEREIAAFAGSTPGFADGPGLLAKFSGPSGLTVDASSNLYLADSRNHRIRSVTPNGLVKTVAGGTIGLADGPIAQARFQFPRGIAFDKEGNAYVADRSNHCIRKLSREGGVTTLAGSTFGFSDGRGSLAKFANPSGLTVDDHGTVYVADSTNSRIRRITQDGTVTTLAGGTEGFRDAPGAEAQFNHPISVAIDNDRILYVADLYNHRIRRITPSGSVTTLAGSAAGFIDGSGPEAKFNHPESVALDSNGNIYVADFSNQVIRKIARRL